MTSIAFDSTAREQPRGQIYGADARSETASVTLSGGELHHGFSIDMDVGGTFTDGFFTDGREIRSDKVLTTPHEVSECLCNCIAAGARTFSISTGEFLRRTAVVRVSTTVGTNLLVQGKGAKIGLIVTKGYERTLYGDNEPRILNRYIADTLVEGVPEQVDDSGNIAAAISPDDLLPAIRRLIARGVVMIVVSFRNAWRNDGNERLARSIVRSRYPVHYLRSVPLQIGTELVHVSDDHARTNSALLNAYIHTEMARALYRAEDRIRALGYDRPLLVVHSNGGCARVAKTMALHTLHSGPAVAAKGGAFLAKRLGLDHVLTGDMGGTSFDIAMIVNGEPAFSRVPQLDGIPISVPMIEIDTIAAGGGTIARVQDKRLSVGPDSAGSTPGPVAYAKGGMEPTVTDANVLLGFIDPGYFLGGRMSLDANAAKRAMDRQVTRHLGITTEQAAFAIRDQIDRTMADAIGASLAARGLTADTFTFFCCGGGGALHACSIAEKAGLRQIIAFPFGSVFSAFGSSTTNIQHTYVHTLNAPADNEEVIRPALADLRTQGERDVVGEGFDVASMQLRIEADIDNAGAATTVSFTSIDDAIRDLLERKGATVTSLRVVAECAIPHWEPTPLPPADQAPVLKGRRPVWWSSEGPQDTPVYERLSVKPGHRLVGPAIIEGADTNYAISPGWHLLAHELGHFQIRPNETKGES
jgi:N-methylhydantoinase A